MEAVAAAAAGATGEGLDGAVQVRVDGKGLIAGASFGPEIIGLTPEELRGETLAALEDAKGRLGLSPLRHGLISPTSTPVPSRTPS